MNTELTTKHTKGTKNKAYPKYKPSGVEWLGDVPEHWDIKRLKTSVNYWVSNVDKVPDSNELPVRLCNYTDVYYNDFVSSDKELMETTATIEENKKFHLEVDDVVITKDSEEWNDIAIKYLVKSISVEATRGRFSLDDLKKLRVILPPLPEQQAIAAFLDRETAKIDRLSAKVTTLIERLKEYRTALISSAVTGKIRPSIRFLKKRIDPWVNSTHSHSLCLISTFSLRCMLSRKLKPQAESRGHERVLMKF